MIRNEQCKQKKYLAKSKKMETEDNKSKWLKKAEDCDKRILYYKENIKIKRKVVS
jgi:hypothetical protein